MRGLSSRNVRPSLAQKHLLHTCTPVRRTFLLPNKRRFNAADAFSILLAPILTTAFVADTTAKQDKSKEWDRQIAAVEAETEQLRERQVQAWSRLQRKSINNGIRQQRRMYTTAAQALEPRDEMEDPIDHDVSKQDPEGDEGKMPPDAGISEEDLRAVQRFDRLIATRLALQLLLQLKSGNDRMYSLPIDDQPRPFFAESYHSLDYILNELGKVGRMLHSLYLRKLPYGVVHSSEYLEKRANLSQDLTDLTNRYRQKDIHLPEFVMSYMNTIAKYQMGPPVSNYVEIMKVFQKMGIMQMAVMAESAVWEAQQYLDNKAVSSILFCHGTEMDAYRLKEFLKRMTRIDLFPRPLVRWKEMYIEDIRLAVPSTHNPWVMASLIRASLCCQQFTIAEAYAQEFIRRDDVRQYAGRFKCWLITCFLASYSRVASWQYGLKWIEQAVTWMVDMLQDGIHVGEHLLGRCILRIMEHCVVCNRIDVYESLLQATIACGIPCPPIDATKAVLLSKRMSDIRMDWTTQVQMYSKVHKIAAQEALQEDITQENLEVFRRTVRKLLKAPQGRVQLVKHNLESKDLMSTEEQSQLTEARLKTVHQSAGTRITAMPFVPLFTTENDVVQSQEYVFSPQVQPEKVSQRLGLNPKKTSSVTSPSITSTATTSEMTRSPLSASDTTVESESKSDILREEEHMKKPSQPLLPSYSDFWPHMTISGMEQAEAAMANFQSAQHQNKSIGYVGNTEKSSQPQSPPVRKRLLRNKADNTSTTETPRKQSIPKSREVQEDDRDFLEKRMVASVT